LSIRYVERRSELSRSSPLDTDGKRAAFAAFFAPLHLLTVRAILETITHEERQVDAILDLGCGTGVAGAAWSLACGRTPAITGIDRDRWVLSEAVWNWRTLGVNGRVRQASMVETAERLERRTITRTGTGVVLGWSVNELSEADRERLLAALQRVAGAIAMLIVEPIARRASPWWSAWVAALRPAGARAQEYAFDVTLPAPLADLDEAAGFRREGLTARALWVPVPARGYSG
jgi:hypothetical protein